MLPDLQVERQNIEAKLARLSKADDSFNKTLSTIFSLASRAHELFKSSEPDEKRQIIDLLFPNLQMKAEMLVFSLRKPFDMFMNSGDHPEWLPGLDKFRTFEGEIEKTMEHLNHILLT